MIIKRSRFPMIDLTGLILLIIPIVSYGMTFSRLFLFPAGIAIIYSFFSALKHHHENQPFVDRHKVRTYNQLFANSKVVLMMCYWAIELVGGYLFVGGY